MRTGLLLPAGGGSLAFHHAQHFFLFQDQKVFVVDLDFRAGVLAEEDAIARLHVQGDDLPVFGLLAISDSDDFAFLLFLFGRVGNDDSTLRGFLLFNPFNQDSIVQRIEISF